jgi:hypothetical protein
LGGVPGTPDALPTGVTDKPHDALFRATFSDRRHAVGLLRTCLPEPIARLVDWRTLRVLPGSFVSEELDELVTDIVYSANTRDGTDLRLVLLLEHQSAQDWRMPLRVLAYIVAIWKHTLAEGDASTSLPPVIPVVVHHGERPWTTATSIAQMLDLPMGHAEAIGPYVPTLQILLDDLTAERSEDLHDRAMTAIGRLVLWALKRVREGQPFLDELGQWADLYHEVEQAPDGLEAVARLMRYIRLVATVPDDVLEKTISLRLGAGAKEAFVTSGQKLIQQGIEQGVARGERALLLRLLRLKFGPLPAAVTARVAAAPVEQVERWAERVLTADSVQDVMRA